MTTVRFEIRDAVGLITLDRPPLNAISSELVADLAVAIDRASGAEVRAIVLTGEPNFAAGADIKEFKGALDAGTDPAEVGRGLSSALAAMEQLAKPVIAAVRGVALGGGMEVALACDFRLFAEDARCGQPEMALGIFPGAGGTQRLPRLIGLGPARDLIYSGRHVSADEALALGIADSIHQPDALLGAALDLAARYAAGPTVALGLAKRAINDGFGRPILEALEIEAEAFRDVFASADAAEGVAAFVEKREPSFSGH